MKKSILFACVYFFTGIINAHSGRTDSDGGHYRHSDGSYHYHSGGSGRGGGLGDWTGTESIGAWLGLLLILYFIFWFAREYYKESNKDKKSELKSVKPKSYYKTDEKIVMPKNRKPIKPSASEADKKTVERKAWVDLLKKNKK
jgi:hypothetical protein